LQTQSVGELRKELHAVKALYVQGTSDLFKQLQELKKAVAATSSAFEKKEDSRTGYVLPAHGPFGKK